MILLIGSGKFINSCKTWKREWRLSKNDRTLKHVYIYLFLVCKCISHFHLAFFHVGEIVFLFSYSWFQHDKKLHLFLLIRPNEKCWFGILCVFLTYNIQWYLCTLFEIYVSRLKYFGKIIIFTFKKTSLWELK